MEASPRRVNRRSPALLLAAALLMLPIGMTLSARSQEAPLLSTAQGVYTEAQAKRGERVHRRVCLRCHISEFYTGNLITNWAGNTLGALNSLIINTMPEDRPSSLKPEQYADMMAFILMLNGFPAGEHELPSEEKALSRIIIERTQQ